MSDTDVIIGEAPARYATALLELAEEAKALKSVEKNLANFKAVLADNQDLQRLVQSPVFQTEDKVAALMAVAKKAKYHALTSQFLGLVAGNRRADELPGIIAAFEDMVARRRGSQVAKVTSAKKLTTAEVASLKTSLKKSLGRAVDIETTVDPDLLGGFVVRIGSRLYDSSLKTKLEDLRLTLKDV
ncbi:F0F1 ATP synthase subunit delta [Litorimonas sp. RW-G-Af-16]|uniref:F0F1 ATP synthase subunit delta n=1 Tax=Litorimonas sp. RW-G-Af-16 TaxID=3241168 RepID=UPI00390C95D3